MPAKTYAIKAVSDNADCHTHRAVRTRCPLDPGNTTCSASIESNSATPSERDAPKIMSGEHDGIENAKGGRMV